MEFFTIFRVECLKAVTSYNIMRKMRLKAHAEFCSELLTIVSGSIGLLKIIMYCEFTIRFTPRY